MDLGGQRLSLLAKFIDCHILDLNHSFGNVLRNRHLNQLAEKIDQLVKGTAGYKSFNQLAGKTNQLVEKTASNKSLYQLATKISRLAEKMASDKSLDELWEKISGSEKE